MEILQIDIILLKILDGADIEFIYNLLFTNKHINNKIFKYYKEGGIILNDMPLFRGCNNISIYLNHYKSYVSGKDFSDNPLWLFNNEGDCKYIEIDDKYVKIENVRFDKPKFFNYVTTYEFMPFKGGLYHWGKLNEKQKYLAWCAIKGFHPEIKLNKDLVCSDLAVLISEIYWHYRQSFSRCYLEIYNIDNCDLINAKCIASNEIKRELSFCRSTHFLEGYEKALDKKVYCDDYFNLCEFSMTKSSKENDFRLNLLNIMSFNDNKSNSLQIPSSLCKNFNLNIDFLLKEIVLLKNIIDEIDEFTITKTDDLRTYNINYLTHMTKNPPNVQNLQDISNLINISNVKTISDACSQQ